MATETEPAATDTAQANGKPRGKVTPPEPPTFTAQTAELNGKPADECDECGEPGKAAAGLGLLICAVAGGLLYIGIDLVTGGALSRKLSGREDDDGQA